MRPGRIDKGAAPFSEEEILRAKQRAKANFRRRQEEEADGDGNGGPDAGSYPHVWSLADWLEVTWDTIACWCCTGGARGALRRARRRADMKYKDATSDGAKGRDVGAGASPPAADKMKIARPILSGAGSLVQGEDDETVQEEPPPPPPRQAGRHRKAPVRHEPPSGVLRGLHGQAVRGATRRRYVQMNANDGPLSTRGSLSSPSDAELR